MGSEVKISRQSHSHAFSSPSPFSLLLAGGALAREPWLCVPRLRLLREAKRAMGRAMGTRMTTTSFPGSFISPPQGSEGIKTLDQAGHVSWCQIYLHGRGPILSKYCRRYCLLPPTINQLSGQPWKTLFRFRSEDLSYQVHCFQHLYLNWIWKL